ncbi:MAG: helix-turn-helix domain-containing protein [Eubacteriales bacterium]|jgi:transcriptional regulator with XRE-family HTH domain
MQILAQQIQTLRKEKGWSQEELAERLGVSRQAVSKWESEQSTPDVEKILALCDCFSVSADQLLRGASPEPEVKSTRETSAFCYFGSAVLLYLGLLTSCLLYKEYQESWTVLPGLAIMAIALLLYGLGRFHLPAYRRAPMDRLYWMVSLWPLTFLLLSMLSTLLLAPLVAPYPFLLPEGVALLVWFVYLLSCGLATWYLFRHPSQ